MPGLVTHEIYAKKLFSRSVMKCDFLNGNFDAFLLGNQGVDVFIFLFVLEKYSKAEAKAYVQLFSNSNIFI